VISSPARSASGSRIGGSRDYQEIVTRANKAIEAGRADRAAFAYLDLGIDPMVAGRDGGMLAARAMAAIRAAGYECQLDRTCAIVAHARNRTLHVTFKRNRAAQCAR